MKNKIYNMMLGMIAVTLMSCSAVGQKKATPASPKKKPTFVKTQAVVKQDMAATIQFVGTAKPTVTGTIKAPANGIVEQLTVRENSWVKKGQIIAMLNPSNRISLIAKNKEVVQRLLRQVKKTAGDEYAQGVLQEQLYKAQADLELSYKMYQLIPITAELSGIISERWIDSGSEVSAKDPLLEVYQPASMVIKAEVNEQYFSAIQVGKKVPVSLAAYPDKTLTGTISLVYPKISETTRAVRFDIKLDQPVKLLEGMMAEVTLQTQLHKDVLCVSDDAIVTNGHSESAVYVIDQASVAHKKKVELGITTGAMTEVVSGLTLEDRVVVKGQEMLKEGKKVKVLTGKKAQ